MRIVCQQLAPVVGALEGNLELCSGAITAALGQGADLVVLPELTTSGYVFASSEEAASAAITVEHPIFDRWAQEIRRGSRADGMVILGFCEAGEDDRLYSSAALLDGGGVRAVYRKTHLWDREKLYFTPGDDSPPVVETVQGRIGLAVCYDLEFPELTRSLALRGADLIVAVTNWPLVSRPLGEHPPEVIMAMAAARANRVFIACCDRAGAERGQAWTEGTTIIDAEGWIVATAPEGTAVADLDLSLARDKTLTPRADALGDRRPELYGDLSTAAPARAAVQG